MIIILHIIYLIHQKSGLCLLSENFSEGKDKFDVDSDLMSGYLVAFKDVGKEMSKGSGDLKVIDMGLYNFILIVKKDVIIVGVADKSDDKMILYHNLGKLQSKFIKKFNSQSELDYWDGQLLKFREFKAIIRENLKNGLIGVVKKSIPIFKIYKKFFLKYLGQEKEKTLEIDEEKYKKALETKENFLCNIEKEFPKQPIAQGYLNINHYKIAHLLDGFHTIEDIATEKKLSIEELYKNIRRLNEMGLLDFIRIK